MNADESLESQVKDTLRTLANSFEGFEQSLVRRKLKQKEDSEKRIKELHVSTKQIELSLKKESKRRKETAKALEAV